jgi:hypothetical protein
VRIAGSRFANGAHVFIGGREALDVQWVNDAQLTATTPAGDLGDHDVEVRNPNGTSGTLISGFHYGADESPAPTLNGVSPTHGPVTGGTPLTLTGSNFVSGLTVRIDGVPATDVLVLAPGNITAVSPAGTVGPKTVTVINPDGKTADLGNAFTFDAVVIPPPSIAAVSPAHGPASGGTTITIDGAHFSDGVAVTLGGQPCVNVIWMSENRLTALTPAGAPGPNTVAVRNPDGQTAEALEAFTFDPAAQAGITPTAKAYPNPFRSSLGHTEMKFSNLSPNGTLRLFSITGELIKELSLDGNGEARWNTQNQSGGLVASGVYRGQVNEGSLFNVVIQR